ncbi:hypothetical protein C8_288 [Cannes 8 virus]|uniref:Uncharacterized protein n=1 Tax=Marseillevirus marseillevirus TaxID=694581 RepID=D2XAS2_GBMV|nr:hypothetical protein MAR_ORF275 [Marseillevirus marseillevirus]ADB04049.1 hypothetical protein MAR_ORF275 [Marseillevirus marseillevirus]AGV01637.1 hypothetical protein C8_288 [Cannes 8 virus]AVR52991.1 hypothetical protein MarSH_286 [Marseillevirus Shanghai 1]
MAEVWMNRWSLVVETENSKLCVTRNRGEERAVFVKEGRIRPLDKSSRNHIALWKHMMFRE